MNDVVGRSTLWRQDQSFRRATNMDMDSSSPEPLPSLSQIEKLQAAARMANLADRAGGFELLHLAVAEFLKEGLGIGTAREPCVAFMDELRTAFVAFTDSLRGSIEQARQGAKDARIAEVKLHEIFERLDAASAELDQRLKAQAAHDPDLDSESARS